MNVKIYDMCLIFKTRLILSFIPKGMGGKIGEVLEINDMSEN